LRISVLRMALALVYAAASYLVLLYLLPKLLGGLGLISGFLPQESFYVALGIVVLEAISALFSTTRLRGVFMVGLGLLGYEFISSTFGGGYIRLAAQSYSVGVDLGFIVFSMKMLALMEAARGCVAIMADNA